MATTEILAGRVTPETRLAFQETCFFLQMTQGKAMEEAISQWCAANSGVLALREVTKRRMQRKQLLIACGIAPTEVQDWQKEHGDDPEYWFRRVALAKRKARVVLTEAERTFLHSGAMPDDLDVATEAQMSTSGAIE